MKEYMVAGPSPYDEDCAQVGTVDYYDKSKAEMTAYINQLNRLFSDAESKGIDFKIKRFYHDFGTYGEVCMYWNIDNEISDQYVYIIESNLPSNWDEQAKKELEVQ
jgi:hypothetical protein